MPIQGTEKKRLKNDFLKHLTVFYLGQVPDYLPNIDQLYPDYLPNID